MAHRTRYPSGFVERFDLRREATPKPLLERPVHRWFVFPHSFGPGLVEAVLDRWEFGPGTTILDPFVGSGTTLRTARERGMDAAGMDLSPLATLASRVKVRRYDERKLRNRFGHLIGATMTIDRQVALIAPPLLRKALGPNALGEAASLIRRVRRTHDPAERDFFLLGLLRAAREISSAKSDGGWLRWTAGRPRKGRLIRAFIRHCDSMMRDIAEAPGGSGRQDVRLADARFPRRTNRVFDGIITSPPYPNRHDYSRIFAVELLLAFLDVKGLFRLRYRSLRSHVEARAVVEPASYLPPPSLRRTLQALAVAPVCDPRVRPMVDGYFKDLCMHLRAVRPLLRRGGRLAYVVGNVRHAGVMVPVDSILADLADRAGYRSEGGWVIRERGNSAQQMGDFGREAARESVVFLRRP
jgi:hypothetical protein